MNKLLIFIAFLLVNQFLNAQIGFTPFPLNPHNLTITDVFEGVQSSSVAFADVDGDSDQDVLITGYHSSGQEISKLYINNGAGSYSEAIGIPFEGVKSSSVAFADIDNDTDPDLLITGINNSNQGIAKLYSNDGTGVFTEMNNTPFEGVKFSSIDFADIDGDSDQDVLITGQSNSLQKIAKLYTNDGAGIFTEVINTPFDGVHFSSIAFVDVDGDNDQDVLITGENSSFQKIAKLYTNNGSGIFLEVIGTPFYGVNSSSIAFADIDGDIDQDLLITGTDGLNPNISKLYTNDGTGIFTEVFALPFDGVESSSIAFVDVDNDNDQDVLITGQNNSLESISKLYTNNGVGIFTEVINTSFNGVYSSSIAFTDVDGDNDQDVLITGEFYASLYTNDGGGNFVFVSGSPFDDATLASVAFADVDGDNDQDVLISSKLYINDGMGLFTKALGTPFTVTAWGNIAFADIDGDNDQDVLIIGENSSLQETTKLYTNDGTGSFTQILNTPFTGVLYSSIAFADIDGDNDQDVLIIGENSSLQETTKLYINDGAGNFTQILNTPFTDVLYSSIAFADIDGDNDQDLMITGLGLSEPNAILYTNDGTGFFSEVLGTPFTGVFFSSIAFADIDGDNDQDLMITGQGSSQVTAKLYKNNGNGNFYEVFGTPFYGVTSSSIEFTDIDNDNDQDLFITGRDNSGVSIINLYTNDGTGIFTEETMIGLDSTFNSSLALADVNADNSPDIIITGLKNSGEVMTKGYFTSILTSNEERVSGWKDGLLTPNPTNGIDTIELPKESASGSFRLLNIKGQEVFKQNINSSSNQIDVSHLSKGIYFYRYRDKKQDYAGKLLVQ
jgi:predicted nucleotidyltransferase